MASSADRLCWSCSFGRARRLAAAPAVAMLMGMATGELAAQPAATTAAPAPWQAGPVSLYPSLVLRDIGVDSNIRNDAVEPEEDFTFTANPRLRAELPVSAFLLTGSASVGAVYYATFKDQQSVNVLVEGRVERTTSRLLPFVAVTFNRTRERGGYEIDARVLRRDVGVSAGAQFKVSGVTSLTGSYRRLDHSYGNEEQFLGTVLGEQLNHVTDLASAGVSVALTPLTTVSLNAEVQRDRFDTSAIRDADSVRVLPAVEFAPDAAITGRAAVGFRQFNPLDARVPEFRGLVGAANVGFTVFGTTTFGVEATRDVMYSFDPVTPYFLVAAGRLTLSQRVGGPFDAVAVAGADRLRYQALDGVPVTGRIERTRTLGGGVGVRVGQALRLTLIYDFTERTTTDLDRRNYQRRRLFGSATYGL